MYELRSYLPKVKGIFSEIIKKYNFEVYLAGDNEIRFRNSNCLIKMTVGWYYVDFGLEFFDPKNPSHEGISSTTFFERKGLIGKKILNDEEIKIIESTIDEIERSLYISLFLIKYQTEYLEGNFD